MLTRKRILIVDDEENFGQMVKYNLEATRHYEVKVETHASQALKDAKEFRPDIILLDIIMPEVEGSEVAHQIHADAALKDTRIVFLTATVTQEEVNFCGGKIGGQFFLAKPVGLEQLLACIQQHIPA